MVDYTEHRITEGKVTRYGNNALAASGFRRDAVNGLKKTIDTVVKTTDDAAALVDHVISDFPVSGIANNQCQGVSIPFRLLDAPPYHSV